MKKTNNKGFSLVELIIVIAIMAILIGVLAPQYIKYVEKSRVSADKDLLDNVYKACTTASSDSEITDGPGYGTSIANVRTTITNASNSWGKEVLDSLGVSDFASVEKKLKSESARGQNITVSVDDKGNYTVKVGSITVPENN